MALNPQVAAHLERLAALGAPRTSESAVATVRSKTRLPAELVGPGPEVHRAWETEIPVAGASIRAKVFDPNADPVDVLVWFHGGGSDLRRPRSPDRAALRHERYGSRVRSAGIKRTPPNWSAATVKRFPLLIPVRQIVTQ